MCDTIIAKVIVLSTSLLATPFLIQNLDMSNQCHNFHQVDNAIHKNLEQSIHTVW